MVKCVIDQTYVICRLPSPDGSTGSKCFSGAVPLKLADSQATSSLHQESFAAAAFPSSCSGQRPYPSLHFDCLVEEAASTCLSLDWHSFERVQRSSTVVDVAFVVGGKLTVGAGAGSVDGASADRTGACELS